MVRIVDRKYLVELVKQNYCDQETNCFFWCESNCRFCKKSKILEKSLEKKSSTLQIVMFMSEKYLTKKMIQLLGLFFQ